VVNVEPFGGHTERCQRVALSREILSVGGDAGLADQQGGLEVSPISRTFAGQFNGRLLGDTSASRRR